MIELCNALWHKRKHFCMVEILSLFKSLNMKNLLATFFAIMAVVCISGCQKDDFKEVIGLCPEVISTSPENGATAVALNKVITVTFNTRMDTATINQASFKVQGATLLEGTYSFSGFTASFRPTNLLTPNTAYTGTVTTLAKEVTGNALQRDYVWSFVTGPIGADLHTAARFGVFAGTGIANTGFSEIRNMDVGLSGGIRSAITGFPPAVVVNGAIYAINDQTPVGVAAMLAEAKANLIAAYLFAEGTSSPASVQLSGDQGGRTLSPGIYKSDANLLVQTGNLTLNAGGDENAVWIFQVAGDINTVGGTGGDIILAGGAQAKNVYWQTGGSAAIGAGTSFNGNVLALNSITLNFGANVVGRLLARNGSITMNTNIINKP
jgi:hypothetical protein